MRKLFTLITVLLLLALTAPLHAASISLTPAVQSILVGNTATVDVDLTLGSMETLLGFDFAMTFDPNILAFNNIQFGSQFSDYFPAATVLTDAVTFNGFYFDSQPPLTNGTFELAELIFNGIGIGSSILDMPATGIFANTLLIEEAPDLINVSAQAQVDVVPVPAGVWLLGSGVAGFAVLRRKFKK